MACQSPYFSNILTTPVIVGCHRLRFHKTLLVFLSSGTYGVSSVIFSIKRHFVLGSDFENKEN